MLTLNASQLAVIAKDNKTAKWVFYIHDSNDVGYSWGTSALTPAERREVCADAVITEFGGIELRRNMAENTVIAPSEITFTMSNPSNAISFDDFNGGYVIVELWLSDGSSNVRMASWKFRIKMAQPHYQTLKIVAEDYLQYYLKGNYPNTRLPDEIFPSNRTYNSALCVPVPFGTAYVPLRDVFINAGGYIMLGDPAFTYTITKIRSPRSLGAKSEWSSDDYSFIQSTQVDSNAVNWRVFQAIIADSDSDGTVDSHGCWLTPGGPVLDPPVEFTRSDTATMTNPADVIAFVLEDMGVPSAMIDTTGTFAAAHTIYDGWGLTFKGAFYYKQEREKVLAQLLTQCHSCLRIGETIELHVLVKDSQKTITGASVLRTSEIGEGTFSHQPLVNTDLSDSGYVAYQESGESQDELVKVLVAADGASSVISNEVLQCPFVQDSQDVQRIGILHYQRKLLKEAQIGFTAKGTCLALQPDDIITINADNYGGTYVVLVDSVKINKDISIQIQCTKFLSSFDDWEDISASDVTIAVDTVSQSSAWSPVISGPDATASLGRISNSLSGRLKIGDTSSCIVLDPSDPLRISVLSEDVEVLRIGNLNGYLDYLTDLYGIGIGDLTNYLKYDPTNGLIVRGNIIATTIDIGGADNTSFHVDVDGHLWSGAADYASAPFKVSNAGALSASSGMIGGWLLSNTMLMSGAVGEARIELDQNLKRISIKDSTNASKVAMGYLNGLMKHDGNGSWGAGDYGFWALQGDRLVIDGDVEYTSGDWIVENDASYLIKNATDDIIIRLGTDSGHKGLFLYNTGGDCLIKFLADGIALMAPASGYLYNTVQWGDGSKYGTGIRVWINNSDYNVPFYCIGATAYGDFHFVDRISTPTGAAEVGDTCVVAGDLMICTADGTPGTWEKVGLQT